MIALNATLRSECERVLPSLDAAKSPATPAEILEVIVRKMPAYGVTAKHANEWGVTFESYLTALDGFPLYAVEDAFARWDRGEGTKTIEAAGFPPRPPQVALLAQEGKREIFTAAYRARKALLQVEKRGVEWTAERKREERQKMIDQGLLTPEGKPNFTVGAKPMPNVPRRDPHEVAEQLRNAEARRMGAPISRSHAEPEDSGEVL